jgi:ferrous iron transport protein A
MKKMDLPAAPRPLTLLDLAPNEEGEILTVLDEGDAADLNLRLGELGFLPGERVRLLARAPFGGPLAIRLGSGTFALRRDEARGVMICRAAGRAGSGT